MSVVRNGQLYVATRITGPTANVLGLDFASDREPYVRDFSEPENPSPVIDSIRRQVVEVLRAAHIDESHLVGIQFDSRDSPSEIRDSPKSATYPGIGGCCHGHDRTLLQISIASAAKQHKCAHQCINLVTL